MSIQDSQHAGDSDTELLDKQDSQTKEPPMYKVIMWNDDYTPMDFVVAVLVRIFEKETHEAEQIMLAVHKAGRGVAGVYTHEVAETKVQKALSVAKEQEFPFRMTIEAQ